MGGGTAGSKKRMDGVKKTRSLNEQENTGMSGKMLETGPSK